jgi:hypothetical protein
MTIAIKPDLKPAELVVAGVVLPEVLAWLADEEAEVVELAPAGRCAAVWKLKLVWPETRLAA